MHRLFCSALVLFLLGAGCAFSSAEDLYIAPSSVGAGSGTDCANALPATFFNTPGNWGVGTAKISAGDTVHLCGVFSSPLTTQASGSSGSVITLTFESGAGMSAAAWGAGSGSFPTSGALNIRHSYIHVTSAAPGVGTQGSIVATLSGAVGTTCPGGTCTTDSTASGVYIASGLSDVEVDHLTINNIFLCNNAATCNSGHYSAGIFVGTGATETNLNIHDNTIDGVGTEIFIEYSGGSLANVNIHSNNLGANHGGYWGVAIGSGSSGNTTSGVNIFGNTIAGCSDWTTEYSGGGGYHCDGVIVYSSSASNLFNIYNNSINFTGAVTGDIFCTYGSAATGASCNIFNNVLSIENSTCSGVGGGRALWIHSGAGTQQIFNNTLIGNNASCYLMEIESGATVSLLENNIFTQEGYGVEDAATGNLTNVNYNLYNTPKALWHYGGTYYTSLSSWQGLGFDANGLSVDPLLSSSGVPGAGSPVIGKGANFYSTCNGQANPGIGALCYDRAGTARPASGNWDIGAYQSGSSMQPAAPTGLKSTVK